MGKANGVKCLPYSIQRRGRGDQNLDNSALHAIRRERFGTPSISQMGAASASPTCSMRSVAAPRLNTPPFAVGVEHDDPAVVGSEKSEKHGAHAAGQLLGVFRHRSRAHEFTTSLLDIFHGGVQCHNHANHQDHRPQLSPRRTSNSARSRPTTTRRRRCDSSPSAPSAAASRRSST